jgi:hypothetical protein
MKKAIGYAIAVLLFAAMALAQCPYSGTCPWDGSALQLMEQHQVCQAEGCKWIATYQCAAKGHTLQRMCD